MTAEDFIGRAREIYGNRYIYDLENWQGAAKAIAIWCRQRGHKSFRCYPNNHIGPHRQECRLCKRERRARGGVLGSVYLLCAKSERLGSLANFGRSEWLNDRQVSHCVSDGVDYEVALRVDGLTFNEQCQFEGRLLKSCARLRFSRLAHRHEVFLVSQEEAEQIFMSVARKLGLSSRVIKGALRE